MSLEHSTALAARLRASLRRGRQFLPAALTGGVLLAPHSLWACAACYGQSDSAMAAGMNWGILSLLGVIVFVLGGVAGFFVFLARRSVKLGPAQAGNLPAAQRGEAPVAFAPDSHTLGLEPMGARGGLAGAPGFARRRPTCAAPGSRVRN